MLRSPANGEEAEARETDDESSASTRAPQEPPTTRPVRARHEWPAGTASSPHSTTQSGTTDRYRIVRLERIEQLERIEPDTTTPTAEKIADGQGGRVGSAAASAPGTRGRILLALGLIGYALLNLGDLITTRIGLTMGLREGNPLMNRLLASYGFDALIFYKVLVVILVTLGIVYLMRQHQRVAAATLLLCSLLVGFAVVSNLAQFAAFAHALSF